MNKSIRTVLFAIALPAFSGPIVSVQPASSMHNVGDVFSVQIAIADAVNLVGYQFDVGFDPTVLQVSSVTFGPFLGSAGSTITALGGISNTVGLIDSMAEALTSGSASGAGVLASLNLQAVGAGTSSVTISNAILLDSSFAGLTVTLQGGSVSVGGAAVPEPGTFIPLGILSLALLLRRVRCKAVRSLARSSPLDCSVGSQDVSYLPGGGECP